MFLELKINKDTLQNERINTDLIEYYQQDRNFILIKFVSKEFVREYHFDSNEEAQRCLERLDGLLEVK